MEILLSIAKFFAFDMDSVVLKPLSCFNTYLLIFSSFTKIPNKARNKNVNIVKKWTQWNIKTDSHLLIC